MMVEEEADKGRDKAEMDRACIRIDGCAVWGMQVGVSNEKANMPLCERRGDGRGMGVRERDGRRLRGKEVLASLDSERRW